MCLIPPDDVRCIFVIKYVWYRKYTFIQQYNKKVIMIYRVAFQLMQFEMYSWAQRLVERYVTFVLENVAWDVNIRSSKTF